MDSSIFYAVSTGLIAAGITIIIIAIVVASTQGARKQGKKENKGRVKAAGVIMIGPIPIIFGTDKKSVEAVLALALALVIAVIIALLVNYWLLR